MKDQCSGQNTHILECRFAGAEPEVRAELDRVGNALAGAGVTRRLADRVRIVLAEVFNNIVEHAYAGRPDGQIHARITYSTGSIACEVRDQGAALPKGALPRQTWPLIDPDTPETWPEGGFGWAMVRALTQDLSYRHQNGENILQFQVLGD